MKKTVTDQTATCFPFWEIWLVNLKYTWSCCHCILSICLQVSTYLKSLVSLIYSAFIFTDLSLSKWKCYIIWHIQKKENCKDNCPSRLSGRLSCQWLLTLWKKKTIHKVSDGQIRIHFPCFLAERTWEKACYFTKKKKNQYTKSVMDKSVYIFHAF